jgi:hypothetical protein
MATSGSSPLLADWRALLFALPWPGELFFRDPMTFSRWVTVSLAGGAVVYLLVHGLELLFKGGAALFGRSHAGLETRRHAGRFVLSAMIVKGVLVAVQAALLVTQAASLSQFLHGILDKPSSFLDLFQTDMVFLIILGVLVLGYFLRPGRST